MATEEELKAAARKAYEAGDVGAAKRLIAAARKAGGGAAPVPQVDAMGQLSGSWQDAMGGTIRTGLATSTMQEGVPTGPDNGWAEFALANPDLEAAYRSGAVKRPEVPPMAGETVKMPAPEGAEKLKFGGRAGQTFVVQDPRVSSNKAVLDAVANGATFGWGPEIIGGVKGMFTGEDEVKKIEDRLKLGAEVYPKASTFGNVAGGLAAPGLGLAKLISKAPGVLLKTLAGAGGGGAIGALTGAGNADPGSRLQGAAIGLPLGAATGGALAGLPAGIGAFMNAKRVRDAVAKAGEGAPDAGDLKAWAGQQFEEMNRTTPKMPQDEFARDWAGDIEGNMRGLDTTRLGGKSRTPEADSLIAELNDLTASQRFRGGIPFNAAHQLKRNFGEEALAVQPGSVRPTQSAAAATGGVNVIDDMLERMTGGKMSEANSAYRRATNAQRVQDMIDSADGYAGGFTSGARNKLGSVVKNKKLQRGFKPGEIEAMKAIIGGDPLERMVRVAGGGLGKLFSAGGGFAGGGVPGAAAGYAISEGAQSLADNMSRKSMEALLKAVTTGKLDKTKSIPDEVIAAIAARLGISTIAGAGGAQ